MILDFMNLIFEPFGIYVMSFDGLCSIMLQAGMDGVSWHYLLSPDILISWLFHMAFAYGMLYVCFILPFRWFKRLIKAPDRKGKR